MFPITNPTLSPSTTTTLLCFHLPRILEWQPDQVPTLVTTGDCLHRQADSRALCDVARARHPGSPSQRAQHHPMRPCWPTSQVLTAPLVGLPRSARNTTRCALVGSPLACTHDIHGALAGLRSTRNTIQRAYARVHYISQRPRRLSSLAHDIAA